MKNKKYMNVLFNLFNFVFMSRPVKKGRKFAFEWALFFFRSLEVGKNFLLGCVSKFLVFHAEYQINIFME